MGARLRSAVVFVSLATATMNVAAQPSQQAGARTGLVVGQVIDAVSGNPVSGAIVTISWPSPATTPDPALRSEIAPRLLTGAGGRFVFRDLCGKLRKDAVMAVEIVFSLPPGSGIDDRGYFSDCVNWAARNFGGFANVSVPAK